MRGRSDAPSAAPSCHERDALVAAISPAVSPGDVGAGFDIEEFDSYHFNGEPKPMGLTPTKRNDDLQQRSNAHGYRKPRSSSRRNSSGGLKALAGTPRFR